MLGGAVGSYALLTMPDQTVRRVELGPRHTTTVGDLPLGDYQVQVKAAGATRIRGDRAPVARRDGNTWPR